MPRKDRYVLSDTKVCKVCGKEFQRPANYKSHQWADRKYCGQVCNGRAKSERAWQERLPRTCPICKQEFRLSPSMAKILVTCGNEDCKRTYKRTVAAANLSATMRADYASGRRKPGKGISPRERALWPMLAEHGWVWQLRWYEWEACVEMDFALPERKVNVEIDGIEHGWARRGGMDERRDVMLAERGWRILRIPNADVDQDPKAVIERILNWA